MKTHTILIWLIVLSFSGFAGAQSLADLAKKEKERRKENKTKGSGAQVITERDLSRVKSPTFTSTAVPFTASSPTTARPGSEGAESAEAEGETEGVESEEVAAPTAIPTDASLERKISLFEQMVKAYRAEVEKIDEEIAKNNDRIQEIEQQLAATGSGGLPVVPAANQIATNRYDPGEAIALQTEQQQLREKNEQLEAQKTSKANELREKGRRAGIPAGYLRF